MGTAPAWTGTAAAMVAPLRWFKWLALTGLLASFASVGVVGLVAGPWRTLPFAGAMIAVLALFGAVLLGTVSMGASALSAGYVVRLDAAGIHYCRWPTIDWQDVQALDVERVAAKGAISFLLAVVLQPHAVGAWPRPGLAARLGGLRLRGSKVRIPLGFAAVDPDLLLESARVIAARAGVPIGRGWGPGSNALPSGRFGKAPDTGPTHG